MATVVPVQHDGSVFRVYDNPNKFNPNIQIFKGYIRKEKLQFKFETSWLIWLLANAFQVKYHCPETLQVSLTNSQLMSAYKSH